ncbi:MAM and LDL-receptor class A domain-containing protein 1-like [Clavelina lepadiformis]|uniref:MAM and LDL-receptor class A domain-containing protein 1-like n=1 Tax=Clavelina lepadiformis TaxID=159417 RepID=UPI0040436184
MIFGLLWKLFVTSQLTVVYLQARALSPAFTNDCDFNRNTCGWQNTQRSNHDDFDWRRGTGSAGKQSGSGARDDHGGGGGYMYIKSSNRNRIAKLVGRPLTSKNATCFQFWYYMKGRDIGHLKVYIARNRFMLGGNLKLVWYLRRNQRSGWRNAKIPLPAGQKGVPLFEALDWKRGRKGNILIDDVTISNITDDCEVVQPPLAAPYQPPPRTIVTSAIQTTTALMTSRTANYSINYLEEQATSPLSSTVTTSPKISRPMSSGTSKPPSTVVYTSSSFSSSTFPEVSKFANNYTTVTSFNKTSTREKQAKSSKVVVVAIVVSVLGILLILVALAFIAHLRRKKKRSHVYADDCSVVMTRMYPEITSDPSLEYRKLN